MHVLALQRVAPRGGQLRFDLGWAVTVLVSQQTSSRASSISSFARRSLPGHASVLHLGSIDRYGLSNPVGRAPSLNRTRLAQEGESTARGRNDLKGNPMNAAPSPVDRVHRCAVGRAGALGEPSSDERRGLFRNEL
ncbi:hypothetical protein ALC57_01483 [Trachymyrmex cornetzi]|uniref:Uncharacterized protein n=1 Tax=Trachymyrmex cornetzi TaxID=471704 RepID=A0A151JPN9_9HYME|nr:hypothetical protein ALC57_01483 [Trachymyrmex cornetzi]